MPLVLLYFIKPLWRIDCCVKSISNVYLNLQMMHYNICRFSKSTRWLSLTTKNPQYIKIRPWGLQAIACAFMVSSWRTFEFGTLLLVWRWTFSMFENENVAIGVWVWVYNEFSSTSPSFSIMQNFTSSTIEKINNMHNAPTHNKEYTLRHIKTK
jgi:hypothetical protein